MLVCVFATRFVGMYMACVKYVCGERVSTCLLYIVCVCVVLVEIAPGGYNRLTGAYKNRRG